MPFYFTVMKDPAFLFYPNDYLGGTMGMTFEEKGAYIELLMMQFNRGHMTSHMIGQTVGQLWDTIKDKFVKDEKGLYYNVRLEIEQDKRKAFTDSRRNNIKGKNQYSKPTKKSGHMTSHMENRNRNENKDKEKEEFAKAVKDYGYCMKLTSAEKEWYDMSDEEKQKAIIHIPKFRKKYENDDKIEYLYDFFTYLKEKMYTIEIKKTTINNIQYPTL